MTLQKKVIILVLLTMVGLAIMLSLSSFLIIDRKFAEMEKNASLKTLDHIKGFLNSDISALETTVKDWAVWDDTYDFVQTGKSSYISSNLTDETFTALKVNLIAFIDDSGSPVWSGCFDLVNKTVIDAFPPEINKLLEDKYILQCCLAGVSLCGLYEMGDKVMVVACHPILTSEGEGPVKGIVIMARYVDKPFLDGLSEVIKVPVFIYPSRSIPEREGMEQDGILSGITFPGERLFKADQGGSLSLGQGSIIPLSKTRLAGYTVMNDIHGIPSIILKTDIPRDIYSQSSVTLYMFITSIILVTAGFLLVYLVFIKKFVLSRLGTLTSAVVEMGRSGDCNLRVPLDKWNDELSLLSREINTMLAKLSDSRRALAESEKKYATLVEQNNDGIVIIKGGNIFYNNSVFATMLGYSTVDLTGFPFIRLVCDDYQELISRCLDRNIYDQRMERFEVELLKNSGVRIPVEISIKSVDLNGERCEMAVVHNLTERKWVEQQLRLHAQLLDLSMDSIFVTDTSGNIIYANPVACSSRGFTQEEVLQMNIRDLVAPEYQSLIPVHNAEREKRGDLEFETVHIHKNGSRIPVEVRSCLAAWGGRRVIISAVRDITERKMAEAQLRLQMDIIDRVLAHTPNVVLVMDLKYHITFANRAFYQLFENEILAYERRPFTEILPVDILVKAIQRVSRKEVTEAEVEFNYKLQSRNILFQAKIINMNTGEILVILYDVTREREKQEKLLLADRLISIGEMSAGVAHELNNPLTSIVGLSTLLVEEPLPDGVKDDIMSIHAEALRASEIVKNLLTFARKHQNQKQRMDITQIIEDVLKLRSYEHKTNSIQVIRKYSPGLPEVYVDRFQIQQVFLNIVLNAEYAMIEAHRGGTLIVTAESLGNVVRVSFSDDGTGIKEEDMKYIFDPFFTTKDVGKGTGLGLSICYGIVAAHGGRIYATSQYGSGATFFVELPLQM